MTNQMQIRTVQESQEMLIMMRIRTAGQSQKFQIMLVLIKIRTAQESQTIRVMLDRMESRTVLMSRGIRKALILRELRMVPVQKIRENCRYRFLLLTSLLIRPRWRNGSREPW